MGELQSRTLVTSLNMTTIHHNNESTTRATATTSPTSTRMTGLTLRMFAANVTTTAVVRVLGGMRTSSEACSQAYSRVMTACSRALMARYVLVIFVVLCGRYSDGTLGIARGLRHFANPSFVRAKYRTLKTNKGGRRPKPTYL